MGFVVIIEAGIAAANTWKSSNPPVGFDEPFVAVATVSGFGSSGFVAVGLNPGRSHFTRNLFFRVPPIKAVVNADILMCQGLIVSILIKL
jgi:hypothetical protein